MEQDLSYRTILKDELERRCKVNSHYSLRAFSRDIGVRPENLSRVLNGKKGLSEKSAKLICKNIGYSNKEAELFCNLVLETDARSKEKRRTATAKLAKLRFLNDNSSLDEERFKVVSDWYHFAILELSTLDNFKNDPKWISKKLGINFKQAEIALERLVKLGLLIKDNNKLKPSTDFTDVLSGPPSEAIKKFHKQVLEKSLISLFTTNVEEREYSTMMISFNKAKMGEVKKYLNNVGLEFYKKFGNGNSKDSVYSLGFQFFRIDK